MFTSQYGQYNTFDLYSGRSLRDKSNRFNEKVQRELEGLVNEEERADLGRDLSKLIWGAKIWALIRPFALVGTLYLGFTGEPLVLVPVTLGACSAVAEERLPHRTHYLSSKIRELQQSDRQNNKPYIVQVARNDYAFRQGIKEIL